MPQYDSGSLVCAPATGAAPARSAIAMSPSNDNVDDYIPVIQSTRVITMRGFFEMGPPMTAPAVDEDDFANLDD